MTKPTWNFKENLRIEPCASPDCDHYILYVKGSKAHVENAPSEELINLATFNLGDIYDLYANVDEILELESKRIQLEENFKKPNKKSNKKSNKKRRKN